MNRKKSLICAVIFFWALFALGILGPSSSQAQEIKYRFPAGSGIGPGTWSLLGVGIAKGFYKDEGLEVSHKPFPSGAAMVEGLAAGDLKVGIAGDLPFISLAAANLPARLIAQNYEDIGYTGIYAAKDQNIRKPTDVYGKRFAMRFASAAHILWIKFVQTYKLDASKIKVINLKPPEIVAAYRNKEIDGFCVWYPFILEASKTRPADKLHTAPYSFFDGKKVSAKIYHAYTVAFARDELIKGQPEAVKAFLKGMVRTSNYIRDPKNRDEVVSIIAKGTGGRSRESVELSLDNTIYKQDINQEMAEGLTDTAQTMYGIGKLKTVPKISDYIYSDALKAVAPNLVSYEGTWKP